MKGTSVVSFLITLMLAGAVCIQGQEPVKDTNGDPVQTVEQYYILPVNNTVGLVPSPPVLPYCPFAIGIFQKTLGLPISFAYPNPTPITIVKTYNDVTIEFKSKSFCTEFSNFWVVDKNLTLITKFPLVIVGGNPERKNSWFQIEEGGEGEGTNTYKLTTFTGSVGYMKANLPFPWYFFVPPELVLTNDTAKTLIVKFQKVDDPTTATTSTHAKV